MKIMNTARKSLKLSKKCWNMVSMRKNSDTCWEMMMTDEEYHESCWKIMTNIGIIA